MSCYFENAVDRDGCAIGDVVYLPISPPAPDNEQMAVGHERVILRHNHNDSPFIFVAPRGELHSGWVIGLVRDGCGRAAFRGGYAEDLNNNGRA